MAEQDRPPYRPPQVEHHAPAPAGVLPRHMQSLMICGLALVVIVVLALTGRNAPKGQAPAGTPPSIVDPNDERIRDYRRRIEEDAKRLALEQARLAQTRQSLGPACAAGVPSPSAPESDPSRSLNLSPLPASYAPAAHPDRDHHWIERDREKEARESLRASNIAVSHRSTPSAAANPPALTEASGPRGGGAATPSAGVSQNDDELRKSSGATYRVFEGTVIETVLTNRLDGSFSGPVNCLVTTAVYSHDRTQLLVPQGSRVLGEVSRVEAFGQQRLAVAFQRLLMPDGYSVSLEKLPGLSAPGETGLMDQIDHHYLQVFGVSMALGAIAGLSQVHTQYGLNTSAEDAYRQGVATSLSQSSLNILNRYLNVLPTFTIREGHRIKVYLTADLLLPAYANHRLRADL
jgi:type IV secretion system protein VirB10